MLIQAITGGPNSSKDGKPGTQEDRRVEHVIPRDAVLRGTYECYVEISVNSVFGLGRGGFRHQPPAVSAVLEAVTDLQLDVFYELHIADIVLVNEEARALRIDFQILTQMARVPGADTSPVSQRALKACNDIMNTFRRVDGDEADRSLVDAVVRRCRDLSQSVLGPLDHDSQRSLAAYNPDCAANAKIWAIGHWYVSVAGNVDVPVILTRHGSGDIPRPSRRLVGAGRRSAISWTVTRTTYLRQARLSTSFG